MFRKVNPWENQRLKKRLHIKMVKSFSLSRVVTKDIITDSFQGLRNLFGMRLRGYEDMLRKNIDETIEEAKLTYKDIKWWRLSINPLTNGSCMITIYGEHNA